MRQHFYALGHLAPTPLEVAASRLFGQAGSTTADMGVLKIGSATLPGKFQTPGASEVRSGKLTSEEILTAILSTGIICAVRKGEKQHAEPTEITELADHMQE